MIVLLLTCLLCWLLLAAAVALIEYRTAGRWRRIARERRAIHDVIGQLDDSISSAEAKLDVDLGRLDG